MASACVNNIGIAPDNFLDCPATYTSYGWLSPRVSFSREFSDEDASKVAESKALQRVESSEDLAKESDPVASGEDICDFEFRLDDKVTMLPADELFSNGKLVPLQLSTTRTAARLATSPESRSPDVDRRDEVCGTDPYLFSPKAPRCSRRWKEILRLKKLYQNNNAKQENIKTASSDSSHVPSTAKSLKQVLNRSSKSSSLTVDSSLSLPLLKDSDNESVSISSRLSLSSSSSGHEQDDLPRLSLDSDKPSMNLNPSSHTKIPASRNPNRNSITPTRVRAVKPRASSSENPTAAWVGHSPMRRAPDLTMITTVCGASVDSPRMNSSGKIVFHSLERSSSSPSSFNGGPRFKHRGIERSYSANVRFTPVLNVPFCSLRGASKSGVFGFPLFSSLQQRKVCCDTVNNGGGDRGQQSNSKNRTERT